MPNATTSKEVASLCGRGLKEDDLTKAERMKVYASGLRQREPLLSRLKRIVGIARG